VDVQFWLVAAVGVLALAVLLLRTRLSRLLHCPAPQLAVVSPPREASDKEISILRKLPPSPITRISFEEAMSSDRFESEIEQYCHKSLSTALSGDGLNVIVQSVLLSGDQLTLVYKFSAAATKLFKAGQATIPLHRESGRLLPLMTDRSGHFIEQAKGANPFASQLATSWALVVSAAHLISGMDVVKRLKEVDRKLSMLIATRRIDQVSKLDRIYTECRGLLRDGIDASVIPKLQTHRYDLYELRTAWCREISHLVRSVHLPDRDWWHYSSWWRRERAETEAARVLVPIAQSLQLLQVALLTDACLALATGTTQNFFENAVPSERELWSSVPTELSRLRRGFRKETTNEQIAIISDGVDRYLVILRGLVGLEERTEIQHLVSEGSSVES
jgi:hypothetical protein